MGNSKTNWRKRGRKEKNVSNSVDRKGGREPKFDQNVGGTLSKEKKWRWRNKKRTYILKISPRKDSQLVLIRCSDFWLRGGWPGLYGEGCGEEEMWTGFKCGPNRAWWLAEHRKKGRERSQNNSKFSSLGAFGIMASSSEKINRKNIFGSDQRPKMN